ncbi:low temperature requirement protein A [Tsukamurella sp. 8F]|uniref:low temperature requirement protein A n=1 Tax=unclassified Tsukamurella TaxID=2633480 RepID=UPI0023B9047F|nr:MULTISPECIES: low temperature requirement protein A [unclassified Tsukamurella]MDF0530062.1 low temperature requirement protein A [Tsukamurella sp. 8J]MDF0586380.1 low temperature requirement protein A [Tsukamurella sp. 8F]
MGANVVGRSKGAVVEVRTMELFFDLVYVFAVSQLAGFLYEHLTGRGSIEALVLFGGVWWVWNYTTWATNFIDPDRLPVRLLMVTLMLLSLVMADGIAESFGERGPQFAIALALMQVVRPLFVIVTMWGHQIARNYLQLGLWSAVAAAVWIAGAFCEPHVRLYVWIAALTIDVAAPLVNTYVPGLGGIPMTQWRLSPGHLVERNRLIVIIALGESVLSIGREFMHMDTSAASILLLVIAFATTVSFWWLYFARHADHAERGLEEAEDPTSLARGGYAYAHAVLVAGIIVTAVGAEVLLGHPDEHTGPAQALVVAGGPALFFVGISLFVASTAGLDRIETVVAAWTVALFVALGAVAAAAGLAVQVLAGAVAVVLLLTVGIAAWHERAARRP